MGGDRGEEDQSQRRNKMAEKRAGFLSARSASFVSLQSFPLPPLEETAAPATHRKEYS